MSNFHSLEVVGRGSETQLQVCENLNAIAWWFEMIKSVSMRARRVQSPSSPARPAAPNV